MKSNRWISRALLPLLIMVFVPAPSDGATRWRDVQLTIETGRNVAEATFDPETGRVFAVMRDDFQTSLQIAAYAPGRSTPVWRRTFAPSPEGLEDTNSNSQEILVVPKRHRVYVGGGYLQGTGTGPFFSAGYVYAFDTRTGEQVWSHTDPWQPGMGGDYTLLAKGPNGAVIAAERDWLIGEVQNASASYVTQVASFDPDGRETWRWTDNRRGQPFAVTTTRTGSVVFVGEASINGWAHAYRFALDAASGAPQWAKVILDHSETFYTVAASRDGRTLYVAGSASNDARGNKGGSRAPIHSVSAASGRIRWTRHIGRLGSMESLDDATRVITTRSGPCVTGAHAGYTMANDYEPILPDDGFIACYSAAGKRRWIDRHTRGAGFVLKSHGRRLLWAGRQEVTRQDNSISEEVVRFAIRSLSDGTIRAASQRRSTVHMWLRSQPLLGVAHSGSVHFFTATGPKRTSEGGYETPDGFLDRVFR